MLLTCKALIEGGRVMGYHGALLVDTASHAGDADERAQADALVGFMTPIVKACLTEWGVECTYHALQCYGGHGYIAEHGMEQRARDARITTLYEGGAPASGHRPAGRKIIQQQAGGCRCSAMIEEFCAANEATRPWRIHRPAAKATVAAVTMQVGSARSAMPTGGRRRYDYLMYSGYVALAACWWARSVAERGLSRSEQFSRQARDRALHFGRIRRARCPWRRSTTARRPDHARRRRIRRMTIHIRDQHRRCGRLGIRRFANSRCRRDGIRSCHRSAAPRPRTAPARAPDHLAFLRGRAAGTAQVSSPATGRRLLRCGAAVPHLRLAVSPAPRAGPRRAAHGDLGRGCDGWLACSPATDARLHR
jgi:hypothetical protein